MRKQALFEKKKSTICINIVKQHLKYNYLQNFAFFRKFIVARNLKGLIKFPGNSFIALKETENSNREIIDFKEQRSVILINKTNFLNYR